MLLIITPNPALDRTMVIPGLQTSSVHRTAEVLVVAGGKGLNVARAARTLGQPNLICAPLGGHSGEYVSHLAASEGLLARWTSHGGGETRTCVLIVDPQAEDALALNEDGPCLSPADWAAFAAEVLDASASADLCLLSGSLPQGVAAAQLADLVVELGARGRRLLIDTSGPALAAALAMRPYGVKVNAAELGIYLKRTISTPEEALAALAELHARGIALAVVSLGARGAVAVADEGAWYAAPPLVRAVSSIGSGDSLLAGLATALLRGQPLPEALRLGVACGTADALTIGGGRFTLAELDPLLAVTSVQSLDGA